MLKVLKRIVQELEIATDVASALRSAVEQIQQHIQSDACSLYLVDEEHLEFLLAAGVGVNEEAVGSFRLRFGHGLLGYIGEREEPINLEDVTQHPVFEQHKILHDDIYRAYIGIPIMHRGDLIAILTVQDRESRFFSEEEEALLVTLAVQMAQPLAALLAKGALQEISTKKRRRRKAETVKGVPTVPGVALGTAIVVYPPADLSVVPDRKAEDIDHEKQVFKVALDEARTEITELQARAKSSLSAAESSLFDAYLRIMDSHTLINEVLSEIDGGQWAQGALSRVIRRHVAQFEGLEDEYLKERATDLRDLGRRILAQLQSEEHQAPTYPKRTILVSEELTATALMEVPEGRLVGVISGSGSNNSHVSILARALGIPTIMGVGGAPVSMLDGKDVIVDGYNGQALVSPSAIIKKEYRHLAQEEQQLDEELEGLRELLAETKDGHSVSMYVNTGLAAEAGLSFSVGAEGVGLYRTEMPFMMRERFPSEEEQRIMYRQLLTTFSPRPVVMRTLDIGGDKSLPYFPIEEDNPFLGWRGVRITLDQPEIFLQQVRAMIQASAALDNLSIMLPMVSSISDIDISRRLITQAFNEVKEEGYDVTMPPLGIMVEVPSAVYQAYELAKRVDFLSVGTNDLIQYLLAVDRNNPRVADRYEALHPAVLRALKQVVDAGHKAGKPVGICGEMASDPLVVILLVAMGFDSFSMNARGLPRVKAVVRAFDMKQAKKLLVEVLQIDEAREIRNHLEMVIEDVGLGGLIRAGR
ncbi:MAG: phosphoenolpyruvate--protein phosphotransferase [Coxiellaceae bacterium]|nr:phosphoenolpyruvate--protein phosphotransferase [Coxiellaceae bacterium]